MRKLLAGLVLLTRPLLADPCGQFGAYAGLTPEFQASGQPLTCTAVGRSFILYESLQPGCSQHGGVHTVWFALYKEGVLRKWMEVSDNKHPGRFFASARVKEDGDYDVYVLPARGEKPPHTPPADPLGRLTLQARAQEAGPAPEGP